MKKEKWLGLFVLLAAFSGCADNTYKGISPEDEDDDTTLLPVLVSLGKAVAVETKGIGGVDNGNELWNGSKVYVYSFKQGTDFTERMEKVDGETPLVAPECLIDGSIDTPTSMLGKEAIVSVSNQSISWTNVENGDVFFPSSKIAYDFYGYYLDGLTPGNISRTADHISFPVQIDGTQDLMSSKAEFNPEDYSAQWAGLDEVQKGKVKELAYSSYTARRNIQPILHLQHHLVRLKFEIYGGQPTEDVDITGISIESCPYEAVFTVAAKDKSQMGLTFNETLLSTLVLKEKKEGTSELSDLTPYSIPANTGDWSNPFGREALTTLGAGLLLPPAPLYNCVVNLQQTVSGAEQVKPFVTKWDLKVGEGKSFEAGHQYTVRIAVYGLQKATIQVVPEGWIDVKDPIDVDEDNL